MQLFKKLINFSVFNVNGDGESDESADEDEEDDVDPVVTFLESLRLSEYAPLFQVKIFIC